METILIVLIVLIIGIFLMMYRINWNDRRSSDVVVVKDYIDTPFYGGGGLWNTGYGRFYGGGHRWHNGGGHRGGHHGRH